MTFGTSLLSLGSVRSYKHPIQSASKRSNAELYKTVHIAILHYFQSTIAFTNALMYRHSLQLKRGVYMIHSGGNKYNYSIASSS